MWQHCRSPQVHNHYIFRVSILLVCEMYGLLGTMGFFIAEWQKSLATTQLADTVPASVFIVSCLMQFVHSKFQNQIIVHFQIIFSF